MHLTEKRGSAAEGRARRCVRGRDVRCAVYTQRATSGACYPRLEPADAQGRKHQDAELCLCRSLTEEVRLQLQEEGSEMRLKKLNKATNGRKTTRKY